MITIKGGWLNKIKKWNDWQLSREAFIKDRGNAWTGILLMRVFDWFLDGTQLSCFAMTAIIASIQSDITLALQFGAVWWLFVMVSMGEEAGAIGDHKEAWGPYMTFKNPDTKSKRKVLGRAYGVKKAIIFGTAAGALLSFVAGWWGFIIVGAAYPLVYYVGNSLGRIMWKERGWALSEVLYDIVWLGALALWAYL